MDVALPKNRTRILIQIVALETLVALPGIGGNSAPLAVHGMPEQASTYCVVEHPLGTVSYPAGWNLVGIPYGSCLRGALTPGYILTEDGSGYAPFDVTEHPKRGFVNAAWVYFPAGGTLELGCGTADDRGCDPGIPVPYEYDTSRTAGQWQMEGNSNPCGGEQIMGGVAAVYTYTPVAGYQPAPLDVAIPVGHAVWIWPAEPGALQLLEPPHPATLDDPLNPRCS